MPTDPKKDETEQEYVSRCISWMNDHNEGKSPEQRAAICYSIYRSKDKKKGGDMKLSDQIEKIAEKIKNSITLEQEVENFLRDSLSGTTRHTTYKLMWNQVKRVFKDLKSKTFKQVWKDLVADGYLKQIGKTDKFVWEKNS